MAINLEKGQRINLEKQDGSKLKTICVGINWGAIEKKGLFGLKKEAVDLDASCVVYDAAKNHIDSVNFTKKKSNDAAILHSGDDLTGDLNGDDGIDNEIITLDFSKLNSNAAYVAFFLNSFNGQDFKDIPFASIRIYEGTPSLVKEVFATYDIANDKSFAGNVSMIMGVFYKLKETWKFNAIGVPTPEKGIAKTEIAIQKNYL